MDDPPSAFSKNTRKLKAEEEEQEAELMVFESDIEMLKEQLQATKDINAKRKDGAQPLPTENIEEKLKQYEKKLSKQKDNAPMLKSIIGDRSRELHNHEQRASKLKQQLEDVEKSLETSTSKEEAKVAKETERHLRTFADLEAGFQRQREVLKKKLVDLKEKSRRRKRHTS